MTTEIFDMFTLISKILRNELITKDMIKLLECYWLHYHEKLMELLTPENQQKFLDYFREGVPGSELELMKEKSSAGIIFGQKSSLKKERQNPDWHYDIILDKQKIEKFDEQMIDLGIIGNDLCVIKKHREPNLQIVLGLIIFIVDDISFRSIHKDKRGRKKKTTWKDKIDALLERYHIKNNKMMKSMPEKCKEEAFYNLSTLRDHINNKAFTLKK